MITLNEMQFDIVNSRKPVVIAANGIGAGHTYGTSVSAVVEECLHVSYYVPNPRMVMSVCKQLEDILKQADVKYRFSVHSNIFSIGEKKIRVLTPEEEGICEYNIHMKKNIRGSLVIIDQVEMFPKYFVRYQLHLQKRCKNKLIFTTQPFHCGWRDIKTEYGLPVFDRDNLPECVNKSWDYDLINWKQDNLTTRATIEDYFEEVDLITGYDISKIL